MAAIRAPLVRITAVNITIRLRQWRFACRGSALIVRRQIIRRKNGPNHI
jgi:hypothetical protein